MNVIEDDEQEEEEKEKKCYHKVSLRTEMR